MELDKSKIVILALSKWDGEYSSTTFSLAKAFSEKKEVIYIDKPVTWKDYLLSVSKKKKPGAIKNKFFSYTLEYLNDNLIIFYPPATIPINFLPKNFLYKKLKRINEKILFNSLNKCLEKLNWEKFIYLNIFNPFFDHTNHIQPILSIYYTVDNISESAYVKKHGVWLEPDLMKKADVNLATSLMLKKAGEKYSKKIYHLPNAADLQIFNFDNNYDNPKELENISTEIITFVGHLDMRTDIEILKTVLSNHKDKTLLIIGPISLPKEIIQDLRHYKNILFVGAQPIERIPSFLKYSSCTIIPFKCNELTKGIYPLKINEYLAMGLPVVSTYFSEDITNFEHSISLAENPEQFSNLIDWEISNNTSTKISQRIKIAKENTWPKRVSQFWEILKEQ
ncbi:Glycosyltransferase involved in cell wall bisynthesis [Marivirga sericea]|uniref:Glycosyltransferase involved in cell wall bisynthesis n=1 Tax=Marivirga sericea TaxID=1028 RepID=A0A1X7KJX7_9BACT|nr:glycosyltransferase [Marivirga sericea]SMG41750.1 Glycosyltransferase involved in cell wall bisynthesis [Marivirga sericea]